MLDPLFAQIFASLPAGSFVSAALLRESAIKQDAAELRASLTAAVQRNVAETTYSTVYGRAQFDLGTLQVNTLERNDSGRLFLGVTGSASTTSSGGVSTAFFIINMEVEMRGRLVSRPNDEDSVSYVVVRTGPRGESPGQAFPLQPPLGSLIRSSEPLEG